MDMTGEFKLASARAKVWAALNDPEILRQCDPGLRGSAEDCPTPSSRPRSSPRSGRCRRALPARSRSASSIRPTATRSPAKAAAVRPASPRAAPRCIWPTTAAARSSPIRSRRKSAASSRRSARASSTRRRARWRAISSCASRKWWTAPAAPPRRRRTAPRRRGRGGRVGCAPRPARAPGMSATNVPRGRLSPVIWVVGLAVVVAILLYFFAGRGG